VVHEFGCGTGLLTRELLAAGHRVIATDASPAMLEIARSELGDGADLRLLALPDDPLPPADAIVSVGHVLSYLPSAAAIDRALAAIAGAISPGGLAAFDICDLRYREAPAEVGSAGRSGPDWAVIVEYSVPSADRFVRDITAFVPDGNGAWRRDDERHENVLIDTARLPALLREHGLQATVRPSFGTEQLPAGLKAVVARRPSAEPAQ
jgi:SAM-dependent methyltransferase